jgi:hypothetical protein
MACKKCGFTFEARRKYKVVVMGANGKRITKVLDDLHRAKNYEVSGGCRSMQVPGGDVMVNTAELLEAITRSACHYRGAE